MQVPPRQEARVVIATAVVMAVLVGWATLGTSLFDPLGRYLPTSIAKVLGWETGAEGYVCERIPAFNTNAERNKLSRDWRSTPEFVGGDVGVDARLIDGRSVWLFGDTLRAPDFPGPTMVRNSMLVFDREHQCGGAVLPDDDGAIIGNRADGVGYWPTSIGVEEPRVTADGVQAQRLGVGLLRVRTTGTGIWDFEVLGPAVAMFDVPEGGTPTLLKVVDIGPDKVDLTRPLWGAASAVVGKWIYVYGTAAPPGGGFGRSLRVARVPLGSLTQPRKYRYWNGRAWSRREADAQILIPAVGGVSQILSVFESDGAWYALSKRDDVFGNELVVWKAPRPTGPFVAAPPVARLPNNQKHGLLRYMPLAHPTLGAPDGQMVVSYSRNLTSYDDLMRDPYKYRPVFLNVDLP